MTNDLKKGLGRVFLYFWSKILEANGYGLSFDNNDMLALTF